MAKLSPMLRPRMTTMATVRAGLRNAFLTPLLTTLMSRSLARRHRRLMPPGQTCWWPACLRSRAAWCCVRVRAWSLAPQDVGGPDAADHPGSCRAGEDGDNHRGG